MGGMRSAGIVFVVFLAACTWPARWPRLALADKSAASAKPRAEPDRPRPTVRPRREGAEAAGDKILERALAEYADGRFDAAANDLDVAIGLGLGREDRIVAHKHLAFIHCMAGRRSACRKEFRKVLALNPALELTPAEAGHPLWGPVFKEAKSLTP